MEIEITKSIEELDSEIAVLKTRKVEISKEIEALSEIKKPKMNLGLSVAMKIIAITSVALFFIKPIYYILALSLLIVMILVGVVNVIVIKSKNKKRQTKVTELKIEESRLLSEITAKTARLSALKAGQNG